jgi:hypothetical protein
MADLWGCYYYEISVKEDEMRDLEKIVLKCLEKYK